MRSGSRRVAAAAAAAAILAAPAIPGPVGEPARRLVNVDADSRDPHWDRPLDGEGLRRAGERMPDGVTYFVDAPGADPVLQGNLKAAAQLFFAPAVPVSSPDRAQWIVRYDRGRVNADRRR